jgi:type III secretory pathway component EscS
MDARLMIVFAPVLLAAGWAALRVLPYAINQFQSLLADNNA